MEYFLITVFQMLGIGFHIMQKIISIGTANPQKTRSQVVDVLMAEDWDTFLVSVLIMVLHLISHFTIAYYYPVTQNLLVAIPLTNVHVPYAVLSFLLAFVLGYAGQRLIYKYLGSAEKYLNEQADKIKLKD